VVKTYGIDNTGGVNETKKIQSALEEHSGSGKVLYFPDGIYKTFTLNIKSNTRIHLSKNTRIIADVSDLKPYLSDDETPLSRFILIKEN
jgi:polygalacturonase